MEQEIDDIKVKHEILDSVETLLEDNIVKLEKDIPEYVNVNTFSNIKVETEAPENLQENFQCSHCPNKYKKIAYLTIHEALHDPRRFCPICYETFTCKKKLGHHLNQHIKNQIKEDKKLAFSCHYCEKSFDNKKKFTLHERVHTNERPHKCEICGEGFKQSGTLKDHYVTHTKEKRYICEICNGGFTTSSSLKRHKRKMHERGKTINCKHCDAKFLNMADFRAHKSNLHPNAGYKRTCPLCSETLRSRFSYRKHKQYHDEYDQLPKGNEMFTKYYLCVLCGEKKVSLNLYLDHRRIHLNYTEEELEEARENNLFKCKVCSQQFTAKSPLFKHMDIHMEKNTKCNFCQNLYTFYGLKVHMRISHQLLHCSICGKVLFGRAKLYSHYQKCHSGVTKTFSCICGKQFVARNQLNLHVKLIHGTNSVKNFKCRICGKRFSTRLIMSSHMAQVHNRKTVYKCSFCDVACATRKEMSTHNLVHKEGTIETQKFCGKKPTSSPSHKCFQCKLCKKIFKSSKNFQMHLALQTCRTFLEKRKSEEAANNNLRVENLRRHMELHSTAGYTCRFCDKKYKVMATIRRHMEVHHPDQKIFRCESCDEEFDQLYEYSKHNNKHKIKMEPSVQINSCADSELGVIKNEPEEDTVGNFN